MARLLEIYCPHCGKVSNIGIEKIPAGRLRTTCNECGSKFYVDKDRELNCKKISKDQALDIRVYPDYGWKVEHPACSGIVYDLAGVGGLVRSGLVSPGTNIHPPGSSVLVIAGKIAQLKKYFDQRAKKNKTGKDEYADSTQPVARLPEEGEEESS